jgi:hypothetical protein
VIEQLGGKAFIDHCILIGTPNNGSLFGKVDAYRRWAQTACELAINFIPSMSSFLRDNVEVFQDRLLIMEVQLHK